MASGDRGGNDRHDDPQITQIAQIWEVRNDTSVLRRCASDVQKHQESSIENNISGQESALDEATSVAHNDVRLESLTYDGIEVVDNVGLQQLGNSPVALGRMGGLVDCLDAREAQGSAPRKRIAFAARLSAWP